MITSRANPKVKFVRGLQAKRATREAEGLFVVEGVRLVEEAAQAAQPPQLVFHTAELDPRAEAALDRLARRGAQIEAVTPAVLAAASDTQSPQGLLAVAPIPALLAPAALTLALVLDGLGDPGNLGAILRAASAAGVEVVFLAPGTVDPYNPKVVRAAMGAHFYLPIIAAGWDELESRLAGLEPWLAEARGGQPHHTVDWRSPTAVIIGAEAAGASAPARRLARGLVTIPTPGRAESLNAAIAAAVLLFEAARQRSL